MPGPRDSTRLRCITRDTVPVMDVSIRDLRNHGGDVVERARRGERLTITRSGKPVAQLTALRPAPLPLSQVLQHWRRLPAVDPQQLRGLAGTTRLTDDASTGCKAV